MRDNTPRIRKHTSPSPIVGKVWTHHDGVLPDGAAVLTADAEAVVAMLTKALEMYMSAFGQALEAHGIAFGPLHEAADTQARVALGSLRGEEQKPKP